MTRPSGKPRRPESDLLAAGQAEGGYGRPVIPATDDLDLREACTHKGRGTELTEDEISYRRRLSAHLSALLAVRPEIPFVELVRKCEGAYPSVLNELLAQRDCVPSPQHDCSPGTSRIPELSPVRAEWYFTRRTANALLRLAGRNLLAIGTPHYC
jgi:hypothetical protein